MAELQILKPEDTKQIRPIDPAALKTLHDSDSPHIYVSELMKTSEKEQNNENLWFPIPEKPGNEEEQTPIQWRIINEIPEPIKKEELDRTKDQKLRKKFLDMFRWEAPRSKEITKNN